MKLGVLQFFSWPERRVDLATVYARALQRIEIMDRTGYDAVWLAEHHFSSFSVCPSVHMVGTLAAARTKRLRIGTAVSLAPFYHPLRLAEEVALLDLLSVAASTFASRMLKYCQSRLSVRIRRCGWRRARKVQSTGLPATASRS